LAQLIDSHWIEQALAASGKASIRRRKLPAEHAVWLVIGLSLYRQLPMRQVVQHLSLSVDMQGVPVPSASVQARQRLGSEPLEQLFGRLPASFTKDIRAEKLARAYAHVYDHYFGAGQSAYV
jgi:hypothetical protein